MAEENDYKKLLNKWLTKTHAVGSPDLDALIDIVRLSGVTRQEIAMAEGRYFTASLVGTGRATDGIPSYVVVETGTDYHILEELSVDADYNNITDGSVNVEIKFYAEDSIRSDLTITGGTPVNMGVPLSMDYVNKLSQSSFTFDSTVAITGEPDFIVYSSQYYKDTSGNRETITGLQARFFEKGRKIIMSPNKRYVFETIVTGDGLGTVDSLTQFSFNEQETNTQ